MEEKQDPDIVGIVCAKFPEMKVCGCTVPCKKELPMQQPQMVIERLYIGAIGMALKKISLKKENVTHILDLSGQEYRKSPELFVYKSIMIADHESANISALFESTNEFIDQGRKSGGILVHCQGGISRSATVVIAYLMFKENMSYQQAYDTVKKARSRIDPNDGFKEQLRVYENLLKSKREPKQET